MLLPPAPLLPEFEEAAEREWVKGMGASEKLQHAMRAHVWERFWSDLPMPVSFGPQAKSRSYELDFIQPDANSEVSASTYAVYPLRNGGFIQFSQYDPPRVRRYTIDIHATPECTFVAHSPRGERFEHRHLEDCLNAFIQTTEA
jgi:hypothetical protein